MFRGQQSTPRSQRAENSSQSGPQFIRCLGAVFSLELHVPASFKGLKVPELLLSGVTELCPILLSSPGLLCLIPLNFIAYLKNPSGASYFSSQAPTHQDLWDSPPTLLHPSSASACPTMPRAWLGLQKHSLCTLSHLLIKGPFGSGTRTFIQVGVCFLVLSFRKMY